MAKIFFLLLRVIFPKLLKKVWRRIRNQQATFRVSFNMSISLSQISKFQSITFIVSMDWLILIETDVGTTCPFYHCVTCAKRVSSEYPQPYFYCSKLRIPVAFYSPHVDFSNVDNYSKSKKYK